MIDKPRVRLTVCSTCVDGNEDSEAGLGGGARLHEILKSQWADHPFKARIKLGTIRCLMACTQGCVASIAATGKMQYLMARLPARADIAEQILDFAALYDQAPTGVTPNHLWPPRMGFHLIARIPPTEPADGDWTDNGCDL